MLPISRPTRSLDLKAAQSSKASTPQTGGTAEGSSSAGIVPGMKSKEVPLAGYLMARSAMHQKVEGQDLKNLRAGHATVQEVNDLLPLGRANVIQDIEKAIDAHTPLRKYASKKLTSTMLFEKSFDGNMSNTDIFRIGAAVTLHAKTGTCGSYAAITNPLHAAKLADMQEERAIVAQTLHARIDHTWSELIPNGRNADGMPILHGKDVIMDGWCKNNLAVLREDSEFARQDVAGNADHLTHRDILDQRTGAAAWKSVEKYKAGIDGSRGKQNIFAREVARLVEMGHEMPSEDLWNAESIFNDNFQEQAAKALHFKRGMMAEIQAVGVSRSLGAN
ncbi:MAG TPA: hypothetical protein VK465_10920, partial [Fibrobacteria bacterium]|nr:hypothetical protein [Fibrobacteria bacterium]